MAWPIGLRTCGLRSSRPRRHRARGIRYASLDDGVPETHQRPIISVRPECEDEFRGEIKASYFNILYDPWRREWDSNPRYGFPHTRFPSVRLKPLGHLSVRPSLEGAGRVWQETAAAVAC